MSFNQLEDHRQNFKAVMLLVKRNIEGQDEAPVRPIMGMGHLQCLPFSFGLAPVCFPKVLLNKLRFSCNIEASKAKFGS